MNRQEWLETTKECLLDIERSINECHGMIDHFIALGNRDEIRYWRRVLQDCKVKKRNLKREMKNTMQLGEAVI